MIKISGEICAKCKGYKRLCGLRECPLLLRYRALYETSVRISSRDVEGYTPPSGVVSEANYPTVSLIYSLPPEEDLSKAKIYDDPASWWGRYSLDEIIKIRSSMISGILKINVNRPEYLLEKEISLALVSENPVSSEIKLRSLPKLRLKIDPFDAPRGLGAEAESIRVTQNPSISNPLEKVIYDELKASEAVVFLYKSGVDIYKIQRAFSLGLLGKYNRKLVPTRWSITAVDTIISMSLLKEIRDYPEVQTGSLYRVEYLGNRFWVALLPGEYSFNWIEIWHPRTIYTSNISKPVVIENSESWRGEASYMDGGYQAARLGVLEYLSKIRRKASVLVVREITPQYYAPVGNWHIRESMRRIFDQKSVYIDSVENALEILREDLSYLDTELLTSVKKTDLYRDKIHRKLDSYFKR
ncbi:MAG: Nre family DNA repair protein [Sulfolobales archaeon]